MPDDTCMVLQHGMATLRRTCRPCSTPLPHHSRNAHFQHHLAHAQSSSAPVTHSPQMAPAPGRVASSAGQVWALVEHPVRQTAGPAHLVPCPHPIPYLGWNKNLQHGAWRGTAVHSSACCSLLRHAIRAAAALALLRGLTHARHFGREVLQGGTDPTGGNFFSDTSACKTNGAERQAARAVCQAGRWNPPGGPRNSLSSRSLWQRQAQGPSSSRRKGQGDSRLV